MIKADKRLVYCCWLYCGSCNKYQSGKCKGCKDLDKTPFWCTIRDCCTDKELNNCAECKNYDDLKTCNRYNGFVIKSLGYLCGSDRYTASKMIKEKGVEELAKYMAFNGLKRISRK